MSAIDTLTARWSEPDPFAYDPAEIAGEQLEAAQEMFASRRQAIRVLDRRASESGVDAIERPEDVIPLLFSHTTYKSYPDAFVRQGRWDRLCAWLGTLSTYPVENIDLEGIEDIDDWVDRLHDAGHRVMTTSGTTGRTSFINTTEADKDAMATGFLAGAVSVAGADPDVERTAFLAAPPGRKTIAQLAVGLLSDSLAGG